MREGVKAHIDVRRLRISRGWRHQVAAEMLGISRSYLSATENRKRGYPCRS